MLRYNKENWSRLAEICTQLMTKEDRKAFVIDMHKLHIDLYKDFPDRAEFANKVTRVIRFRYGSVFKKDS